MLLAWWVVGNQVNRRRAAAAVGRIRESMAPLGKGAKLTWIGNAAFRIHFEEPAPGLQAVQMAVLLHAMDLPFVLLWNRLRGRGETLTIRADFERPPAARHLRTRATAADHLPGKIAFALRQESPHLHLSVRLHSDTDLGQVFRFVADVANRRWPGEEEAADQA